jgi:predicted amidohydrolase
MKIALLQINPTVGDLAGNARLIAEALRDARARGADLAVTPELALVGYLPRDLLLDQTTHAQKQLLQMLQLSLEVAIRV